MIRFECPSCARVLRVSHSHAGKKGKCPKCSTVLRVPRPRPEPAAADLSEITLILPNEGLDAPVEQSAPPPESPGWALQDPARVGMETDSEDTDVGKRPHPWPLDVLLYPANLPGLLNLLIFWLLPPLLGFLPFLGFILNIIISIYVVYYYVDCVRTSAEGEVRAPENIGNSPSLGQAFGQLMEIIALSVLLFGPTQLYLYFHGTTPLYWVCLGASIFLLPMALLAVIQVPAPVGFNPLLWIVSIGATLLPYLGLLLLVFLLVGLLYLGSAFLDHIRGLSFLTRALAIYATMILSHLLGRFCFRYEERLRW